MYSIWQVPLFYYTETFSYVSSLIISFCSGSQPNYQNIYFKGSICSQQYAILLNIFYISLKLWSLPSVSDLVPPDSPKGFVRLSKKKKVSNQCLTELHVTLKAAIRLNGCPGSSHMPVNFHNFRIIWDILYKNYILTGNNWRNCKNHLLQNNMHCNIIWKVI